MTEEVHRKLFGHVRGSVQTRTYSHSSKEKALQIAIERLHQVETISQEESNRYERKIAELQKQFNTYRMDSMKKMLKAEQKLSEFAKLRIALLRAYPRARKVLAKANAHA